MSGLIDNIELTMIGELKDALKNAESIDILTAYFYFSGFSMLAEELQDKKVRILVGCTIDPKKVDRLSAASKRNPDVSLSKYEIGDDEITRGEKVDLYIDSFIALYNKSSLSESFDSTKDQSVQLMFEEKLQNGTLEIKMTAEAHHGKVFVINNKPEYVAETGERGAIFMGSSNFTYRGLLGQGEVNEKFTDDHSYIKYNNLFASLWDDGGSIDINVAEGNDRFLQEIQKRLWIHSTPDPYKIYIRILHELYKKESNPDDISTPAELSRNKFINLRYQLDAILEAVDCIKKNNGVIIADVVGLGKSIIASAVAKNLDIQRTFIIAPPHLTEQWRDYVMDFGILGAHVESSGKIDQLHDKYAGSSHPALFIIDEAHRYRNELTDDYQYLHQLTRSHEDNKVILLTATPYNNRPQDLFAMIKLFQTPSRSTIHSVDNLSFRFHELIKRYRLLERQGKKKQTEDVKQKLQELGDELRMLISPVIIRRSRIDLQEIKIYAQDLKRQKITFPEVVGPELIEYDLGEIREPYLNTLFRLTESEEGFIGARYMSSVYLRDRDDFIEKYKYIFDVSDLQTAQRNLADFIRRLLVTRFESSKYAFEVTLRKIRHSLEMMIAWWDRGYVPILKKGDLIDPHDIDLDEILERIESAEVDSDDIEKIKKTAVPIPKEMFDASFIDDVRHDKELLDSIYHEWFGTSHELGYDPKQECVAEKIASFLDQDPDRKIVIFSSYADTAQWVADSLVEHGFRALLYTGATSGHRNRLVVTENFDASYEIKKQKNDYDIIVATDALSEGFNLHRAGIVINYDIPYNPTRVVQRIGRINRINKKVFDKIYIYNFFPTDIGDPITNIKNIATLKMLLINSIIGSDTRTLTPDEDLQSYFQNQYREADTDSGDKSWDNEYRNDYEAIRHDTHLIDDLLTIPERTRIVRRDCEDNISISFAKRGNGVMFAFARFGEDTATISSPEHVLRYFKASPEEKSFPGDAKLDAKFDILIKKIHEPHPLPKIEGRRAEALKIIEFLRDNYRPEKDYLYDLYDTIKVYDDLSDGELKFIAQLRLNGDDLKSTVDDLLVKFTPRYIQVIKRRAESIDRATEIMMFTEDLRK